jgi:archaellum component FlaC
MSIDNLEEERDSLLDDIEQFEEKCDTLELCEEDDGCKKCESYKKIEDLSAKVEEIENRIESLMPEVED